MATLADDAELLSRLGVALTRQSRQAVRTDDPRGLLRLALRGLIAQGYDTVSPTHLALEIKWLIVQGGAPAEDVPEWVRPEWVGRMMRDLGVLEDVPAGPARIRLHGANLRFYPVRAAYVEEVREWFQARKTEIAVGTKRATEFCGDCESCPYSTLECEIMVRRLEGRKA